MSIADADKPIKFEYDGITIGGQPVPGCIANDVVVQEDTEIPGFFRVSVTFLTNVYPVSAAGLVDEPINTRHVRPARPDDD